MAESGENRPTLDELYGDTITGEYPAYLGELTPAVRKLDNLSTDSNLEAASKSYWLRHSKALEIIHEKGHDVVAFAANHGRGFMIGAGVAAAVTSLGIGAFVVPKLITRKKRK
jgi:hypothetical protein